MSIYMTIVEQLQEKTFWYIEQDDEIDDEIMISSIESKDKSTARRDIYQDYKICISDIFDTKKEAMDALIANEYTIRVNEKISQKRIPKIWKDIPFEDFGKDNPEHEGIYGVTCPNCGSERDLYSKSIEKRVKEKECNGCTTKFRFINGKAQATT